jgi:hypothetical protein
LLVQTMVAAQRTLELAKVGARRLKLEFNLSWMAVHRADAGVRTYNPVMRVKLPEPLERTS